MVYRHGGVMACVYMYKIGDMYQYISYNLYNSWNIANKMSLLYTRHICNNIFFYCLLISIIYAYVILTDIKVCYENSIQN